eukprot:TRINITY_DN7086_c0_g1_i1.p1 TRINITY_DN7086_c0_g1~~TRINITY_DN7086_c0_g1_i1.p1  ORF type:complete len:443 (-),score=86.12 TRINITY_DN7086_c0_g1_i1:193-1521(-)
MMSQRYDVGVSALIEIREEKKWKKRWILVDQRSIIIKKRKKDEFIVEGSFMLARLNRIILTEGKNGKRFHLEDGNGDTIIHFRCRDDNEMSVIIDAIRENVDRLEDNSLSIRDFEAIGIYNSLSTRYQYATLNELDSFVRVRKVDTAESYAMKVISKASMELKYCNLLRLEVELLKKLHHPFIVDFLGSFQSSKHLYFIFDYSEGGDVLLILSECKRLQPDLVLFFASELILAFEYLHQNDIILPNFRPEINALITFDGHIKIAGYGMTKGDYSTWMASLGGGSGCMIPDYICPEMLKAESITHAIDWWSFGCLLYEMLFGLPPFYSMNIQHIYQMIISDNPSFPQEYFQDEATRNLISLLLEKDPNNRPSDAEAIKLHPYFHSVDWKKIIRKEVEPPMNVYLKGEELLCPDSWNSVMGFWRENQADTIEEKWEYFNINSFP